MAFQTLSKGSKGNDVITLQKWLNVAAYLQDRPDLKLTPDGEFGGATEKALIQLVGVPAVTEATAINMAKAINPMKERVEAKKQGKQAPDAKFRALVKQDQEIFQRLLEIYAIYEKSPKAVREKYKKEFTQAFVLAENLVRRFRKLSASQQQVMVSKGYPSKYKPLVDRYTQNIGAIPVIIVVALACIIVGGIATYAVMDWLTPAYSESTVDYKQSEEIRRILDQLPASDRDTLIKDVEKQVDAAYTTGARDGKVDGFFGGTTTLIMIGGAAAAYFLVIEPAMDNRKVRRAKVNG